MSVVDVDSGAVTARIPTGTGPTSVAVTARTVARAFVTGFDDGTVLALDTATDQPRGQATP